MANGSEKIKLVQRALAAEGYSVGQKKIGFPDGVPDKLYDQAVKAFQSANALRADGIVGPLTETALFGLPPIKVKPSNMIRLYGSGDIPSEWMPKCKMDGIVVHWTAGANKATEFDRQHYHILIEDDGNLVRGIPHIDANSAPIKPGYAAHTLGANTGRIGVSLCCMGDFKSPSRVSENPFVAGPYPMTSVQWAKLPIVLAQLCKKYNITPTRQKVLSHAEVESTLGIKQKGKWDITRLAFDSSIKGAIDCGDAFRSATLKLLQE